MSDNIFEKMTEEERTFAWMYMMLNKDKIIEKAEKRNKSVNKSVKVRDLYKERTKHSDIDPVEMVDIDDKVDPWYGLSAMVITEEQVEELKNGKAIYFSDGEYAHVIVLDKVANGIRTYHKNGKRGES
jgi:dsDNA-binding SOS-regulon protein